MSSRALRERMVAGLVANGSLQTPRIREAFLSVQREDFLPVFAETEGLEFIYRDAAITVRERDGVAVSSSSQPSMMAQMLECLHVQPGSRVLEVGLGTGYNAALLSEIVGPGGAVTSIDIDAELVRKATSALARSGYRVETATFDGRESLPSQPAFDRMIVTASTDTIPIEWWNSLAVGGVLLTPVRFGVLQMIIAFEKTPDGFRSVNLLQGSFMPLYGSDKVDQRVASISIRMATPSSATVNLSASTPSIAAMSIATKQQLLINLMSVPRTREIGPFEAWPLVWRVLLQLEEEQQVSIGTAQSGVRMGIIDGASGRCEVLVAARDGNDWLIKSTEVYGTPHDTSALDSLIGRWHDDGKPDLKRLKFFVEYQDRARAPAWADSVFTRGDHVIRAGWAPDPHADGSGQGEP